LEKIIPNEFGKFSFIQSLLIPEFKINKITDEDVKDFTNQQVDFYLPQTKLVIEIDGQQHKLDDVTRVSDIERDKHLSGRGITTVRITTRELQNGSYTEKVKKILKHLERYEKRLNFYKTACEKIEKKTNKRR
jgi:ATP-dependent DNA helicase RecQ